MSVHQFDTEVAADVGINAAVVAWNIRHWCKYHETQESNFYDGRYWTYNTVEGFQKYLPYLSVKQIRLALEKLEHSGIIATANYNTWSSDRTKWYHYIGYDESEPAIDSDCPKGQMELPEREDPNCPKGQMPSAQKGKALPDNKPDNKPNGNIARDVFDFYNQTASDTGWTVHSKLTDAIRKTLNARLKEHGPEQVKRFITALSKLDWTYKGFDGNRTFRASLIYICRPRTFAEHFDKLVTNQPEKPKQAVDGLSDLERCFKSFAESGVWYGDRINLPHPHRANDYPDELYERYGIKRREPA